MFFILSRLVFSGVFNFQTNFYLCLNLGSTKQGLFLFSSQPIYNNIFNTYVMSFTPELRTHAQKVGYLYKRAMRMVESYYHARQLIRYQQVLLRHRFDCNADVCDPKEQRKLLWLGEDELFRKKHPLPIAKFPRSLGIAQGVAYGRIVEPPDWVLDYWHPLEKAQYPTYFRTRECRKCEYIQHWQRGTLY